MPHSTLTWRTFRLSLLAFTLACGHAVAATGRPGGVATYKGSTTAGRAPARNSAPGAPARFVGVGPTAVASAGVRVDKGTYISMPLNAPVAKRPAAVEPRHQVLRLAQNPSRPAPPKPREPAIAAKPAVAAKPEAAAPAAQPPVAPKVAPQQTAATTPAATSPRRFTRQSSVLAAALSRRPSGGTLHRDPFGSVSSIALSP